MVGKEKYHKYVILLSLFIGLCYSSSSQQNNQTAFNSIKVFQIIHYEGSDLEIKIKLEYMKQFVDYFIVVEKLGLFSQQKFSIRKFEEYSDQKLIYLPVLTFPHQQTQTKEQQIANKKYIEDAPLKILELLANPEDIIILSQNKEIISKESIQFMKKQNLQELCLKLTILELTQNINDHQQKPMMFKFKKITNILQASLFQIYRSSCSLFERQENNQIINGWIFENLQTIINQENWFTEKKKDKVIEQQIWKVLNISIKWFKQQSINSSFQMKKTQPIFTGTKKRKIFSVFPYNGEEHILKLTFSITSSYVDYYVITQGFYSHCGIQKKLTFNYSSFPEVSHKITFLPLKNMPHTSKSLVTNQKCWQNEFFMRNSAVNILKLISMPEDIIVAGDCDQMITREAVQRFDPYVNPWASVQLRLFYFYFNQQSAYYDQEGRQKPNNAINQLKIIVFQELMNKYNGDLAKVRIHVGCNADVYSRLIAEKRQLHCEGPLIQRAGWHFTYILDKENLIKKVGGSVDSAQHFKGIQNETLFKTNSVAPGAHNILVTIEDGILPIQLVQDLMMKKQKSIYAPYFSSPQYYTIKKISEDLQLQIGQQEESATNNQKLYQKLQQLRKQTNEKTQETDYSLIIKKINEESRKKNQEFAKALSELEKDKYQLLERNSTFKQIEICIFIALMIIVCLLVFIVWRDWQRKKISQRESINIIRQTEEEMNIRQQGIPGT